LTVDDNGYKVLTVDEMLRLINDTYAPQQLDPEYDGSCPCFSVQRTINGKALNIVGRCWRVSETYGMQDLYVWGELDQEDLERIALALKEKLDEQEWYQPYRIIYCEP
jgi:hypothetical protein